MIKKKAEPMDVTMTNNYYIAWWNVENLFDIESADRPDYLKKQLRKELKGWDPQVLARKISQLAKVIKAMNKKKGPDLLGVCEIENRNVMKLLSEAIKRPGRHYKVVHHDTEDKRGIDVGFIYDSSLFERGRDFSYEVLKRRATRDIYQVNFKTKEDGNVKNDLIIVGNHWPSRSGGRYDSEPYRIIAAETLAYWHTRILEAMKSKEVPIIFMGDFNDQPHDRALIEYALSTREKRRVLAAKAAPRMLNLMWDLMAKGSGTYFYSGEFNMLDQFIVSKGFLVENKPFKVKNGSIQINKIDPETKEVIKKPIRFGRPSKNLDVDGYSDHFPISMVISEE